MMYVESFQLPSDEWELSFLLGSTENKRTCYNSRYPFGVFYGREVPPLTLGPVTILCGGNGSGKSTILNLIGEKLGLNRGTVFNRSSFFGDYLQQCKVSTTPDLTLLAHKNSRIITSDDVFDYLLELRYMNDGIDHKRKVLLEEYTDARYAKFQMRSLEDLDRLRQVVAAQSNTGSKYVRNQLMNDVPEQSNGESAFLFFTREIKEHGLYLLDEPENSLSPKLQQELLKFLEDSVRFFNCQFIISTHSPFLLAMKDAVVYDLDADPVQICPWTQLEHIQAYFRFFQEHQEKFQQENQ